jgi:hypothetical protein
MEYSIHKEERNDQYRKQPVRHRKRAIKYWLQSSRLSSLHDANARKQSLAR